MASERSSQTTLAHAYKVEELLAMRDSVSESAVSLHRFRDEDAIKEHVLKPSASHPGLAIAIQNKAPSSFLNDDNLMGDGNGGQEGKKPSPTPSIKRGKAEQLLKQHGSPPGLRVTAGGRIVPTDFTPLGSPRYNYIPMVHKRNSYKSVVDNQHHATIAQELSLPNGYVAYNIIGQLCQYVDGNMLPLKFTANGPQMYITPVNFPFPTLNTAVTTYNNCNSGLLPPNHFYTSTTSGVESMATASAPSTNTHPLDQSVPYVTPVANNIDTGAITATATSMANITTERHLTEATEAEASSTKNAIFIKKSLSARRPVQQTEIDVQINALNEQYERIRLEKAEYDRDEIRYCEGLEDDVRATVLQYKKSYVVRLDKIRKQIKELEKAKANGHMAPSSVSRNDLSNINLQPNAPPFRPSWKECFGSKMVLDIPDWVAAYEKASKRRSHAIEIKDPRSVSNGNVAGKTVLNPTSPSYEPFHSPINSPKQHYVYQEQPSDTFDPPVDSETKGFEEDVGRGEMVGNGNFELVHESVNEPIREPVSEGFNKAINGAANEANDEAINAAATESTNGLRHKASFSSVNTNDLFPHDTEEHSLTKYQPKINDQLSNGNGQSENPTPPTSADDAPRATEVNPTEHENSPENLQAQGLRAPQVSPVDAKDSSLAQPIPDPEEVRMILEVMANKTTSSRMEDPFSSPTASPIKSPVLPCTPTRPPRKIKRQVMADTMKQYRRPVRDNLGPPPKWPITDSNAHNFEGKSESYLRGYIAGLSTEAADTKQPTEWLTGYLDAVRKSKPGQTAENIRSQLTAERDTRRQFSNISFKSEPMNEPPATSMGIQPMGVMPSIPVGMPRRTAPLPAFAPYENTIFGGQSIFKATAPSKVSQLATQVAGRYANSDYTLGLGHGHGHQVIHSKQDSGPHASLPPRTSSRFPGDNYQGRSYYGAHRSDANVGEIVAPWLRNTARNPVTSIGAGAPSLSGFAGNRANGGLRQPSLNMNQVSSDGELRRNGVEPSLDSSVPLVSPTSNYLANIFDYPDRRDPTFGIFPTTNAGNNHSVPQSTQVDSANGHHAPPHKLGDSPKRSPAKRLEQLARNLLVPNGINNNNNRFSDPSAIGFGGNTRGQIADKRRWHENIGKRIRDFQRKEREEEMAAFKEGHHNNSSLTGGQDTMQQGEETSPGRL